MGASKHAFELLISPVFVRRRSVFRDRRGANAPDKWIKLRDFSGLHVRGHNWTGLPLLTRSFCLAGFILAPKARLPGNEELGFRGASQVRRADRSGFRFQVSFHSVVARPGSGGSGDLVRWRG